MSAMPEATINTLMIFKAIIRSISTFGVWGWVDLAGASILLFGCAGELWILLNKLPEHNERRASLKGCWVFLDRAESIIRLIGVRLKIIRPRKFSDLKEHLLEGFFISLVAIGVGMEVCSLPFSLNEAADANKLAGQANLQVGVLSNETVRLSANLEEAKSKNLVLAQQVFGLATQTEQISINIAQVRDMVNSPEITAKLNEAKKSLTEANKTMADVKEILISSNLDALSNLKPKPFKERLIDFLNSIDKKIVPKVALSPISITCSGDLDSEQVSELKKLAAEPGAWQYLQIIDEPHGFAWMSDGTEQITGFRFVLYPALAKP